MPPTVNLLDPNDPDYIDPAEPPIDETPPEPTPEPTEVTPPVVVKPERDIEKVEGEIARLRTQRDKLRQDNEAREREMATLREENTRFRARREVEEEERERAEKATREAGRPDPEVDPYGARLWDLEAKQREEAKKRETLEAETATFREQEKARGRIRVVDNYLASDVSTFKTEHPDYDDAAQAVYDNFLAFWKDAGLTDEEANAKVAITVWEIGSSAMARKQSPSTAVYNLAKRIGYAPKAAGSVVPAQPNKGEMARSKIAQISKAQKMQGLGGKTPAERPKAENIHALTAQELADMPDEDYIAMKQHPEMGPLLDRRIEELG